MSVAPGNGEQTRGAELSRKRMTFTPGAGTPFRDRVAEDSLWRFPEWVLRGIGQVDFQNNWLTGVIILAAVFYNSWIYGVDCILGTAVATLTAMAFRADKALIRSGLFSFSGALLAIGVNAYMSSNFTTGQVPSWRLYIYIIVGSALTAAIGAALMTAFGPHKVPTFTWPFNITGWFLMFAVLQFSHLHAGPIIVGAIPHALKFGTPHLTEYTWVVWYKGIGKGIAEVFFQDNWVTGYIMLFALAINTRVGAFMAFAGSAIGIATAMVLGASAVTIQLGLFSYNSVLTAMALGGFFFVANYKGLIWAFCGTAMTAVVWASVAVALAPVGMPAFTGPFCIVATIALFAKHQFPGLDAVAPANATNPEDNYRRWKAGVDLS
jgi:urea transporter